MHTDIGIKHTHLYVVIKEQRVLISLPILFRRMAE